MKKHRFFMYLLTITILILNLSACSDQNQFSSESQDLSSEIFLQISLKSTADYSVGAEFSTNELGNNFQHGLVYQRVYDVTITVGGNTLSLDEALRNGLITEEDIFYYAKLDAKAGNCQLSHESTNGVASYFFDYPGFNLRLIYDVLEAPDKSQHQISHMYLSPPGDPHFSPYIFYDQNGIRYDIEDWGLEFFVKSVTSSSITIETNQTPGQEIGQLNISYYIIAKDGEYLPRTDTNSVITAFTIPIKMNGTGEVSFDWTDFYGALPSGKYELLLYIEDIFDSDQVHPLMTDFMDQWVYKIEFIVP